MGTAIEGALVVGEAQGTLELADQRLRGWPEAAKGYNLSEVLSLDLSSNRLHTLPSEVFQLVALEVLLCSHNIIPTLPSMIPLVYLRTLELSANRLTSLPETVGYLEKLVVLKANNNRLTSLPESIGHLQNLVELHVANNAITTLTEAIGDCQRLRTLCIARNQLTALPKAIGRPPLVVLDFSSNRVSVLPPSLRELQPTLVKLLYHGNNIDSPPPQILSRGLAHLYAYLECVDTDAASSTARGSLSGSLLRRLYNEGARSSSIDESTGQVCLVSPKTTRRNQLQHQFSLPMPGSSHGGSPSSSPSTHRAAPTSSPKPMKKPPPRPNVLLSEANLSLQAERKGVAFAGGSDSDSTVSLDLKPVSDEISPSQAKKQPIENELIPPTKENETKGANIKETTSDDRRSGENENPKGDLISTSTENSKPNEQAVDSVPVSPVLSVDTEKAASSVSGETGAKITPVGILRKQATKESRENVESGAKGTVGDTKVEEPKTEQGSKPTPPSKPRVPIRPLKDLSNPATNQPNQSDTAPPLSPTRRKRNEGKGLDRSFTITRRQRGMMEEQRLVQESLEMMQDLVGVPVPDAEDEEDVLAVLRDGVLLCQVVNCMRPGTIAHINVAAPGKTLSIIKATRNVDAYVSAQAECGVPPVDRCTAHDILNHSGHPMKIIQSVRAVLGKPVPQDIKPGKLPPRQQNAVS